MADDNNNIPQPPVRSSSASDLSTCSASDESAMRSASAQAARSNDAPASDAPFRLADAPALASDAPVSNPSVQPAEPSASSQTADPFPCPASPNLPAPRSTHAQPADSSAHPAPDASAGCSAPADPPAPACLSGDASCAPAERILEPEVRRHHHRKRKLLEFTHSSTRATMLMLAAAVAAFVIENTPALPYFAEFWHTFEVGFTIGGFSPHLSLEHLINDFLMAIFFLMVGLEIKFEMTAGELVNPRKALLPILGAAGGAVLPALVYLAVNAGGGFEQGWGVPMANDIAFCLGILALLGSRVPPGLRSFLSTLTIADDIIAILVIAVFYTANLDVVWLAGGLGLFAGALALNRLHVHDLWPYVLVGLGMWACFLLSGVHATIAGVLLALAIPARSQVKLERAPGWFAARARTADERYDPGEPDIVQKGYLAEINEIGRVSRLSIPPITRLDYRLHVPVYFFILPLFAFSNASVVLVGMDPLAIVTSPVTIGVFFGLLLGKPLGIFLATWATVKSGLSDLPDGVRWGHVAGVSVLGGVGFTMAIFVTNLAFVDPATIAMAKAAILAASLVAGVAGFLVLRKVIA